MRGEEKKKAQRFFARLSYSDGKKARSVVLLKLVPPQGCGKVYRNPSHGDVHSPSKHLRVMASDRKDVVLSRSAPNAVPCHRLCLVICHVQSNSMTDLQPTLLTVA
jgi:hypothetical protein